MRVQSCKRPSALSDPVSSTADPATAPAKSQEDLTQGPVGGHLVRLTIPMFLGISSMILASMVDAIYLGWVGAKELAAVSLTFPVVMAFSSLTMGLGVGATSIMARTLGGGEREQTLLLGTRTLVLVVLLVAVLAVLGWLGSASMFALLGAEAELLALVVAYMNIWYLGLPLFAIPMVATSMLRALGNARTAGILMVSSALLQVLIAPVLMFGLGSWEGMGFLGSAWAFVLSRVVTFVAAIWVIGQWGFLRHPGSWAQLRATWREVLRIGLPAMATNLIGPVSMAVVFALLTGYGYQVVAGFGVAIRVEMLAIMLLMSLAASVSPVAGQNYGAQQYGRIRRALLLANRFSLLWGLGAYLVLVLLGRPLLTFINDDAQVIQAAYRFLLIVPASYGLLGISMVSAACFTALGKPLPALLMSIGRMFVIYLPLAWLGSAWLGYSGIFAAGALANLLIGLLGFFWIRQLVPGYKKFGAAAG